jgi:hypothetical protein
VPIITSAALQLSAEAEGFILQRQVGLKRKREENLYAADD